MRVKTYLFLLCLLATSLLFSQTQYTGPANGDWFEVGNWNNGLPGPGNDALIGGGSSVTIGSPLTVDFSITNFGEVTVAASVAVTGSVSSSGSFKLLATGGLVNEGDFQNFGSLECPASATFVNEPDGNFTNGGTFLLESALTNKGAFTNNGGITATAGTIVSEGVFTNNQVLVTLSVALSTGGLFTNNFGAILTIEGSGSELTVNGIMNNFGTVNNGGLLTLRGNLTNNNLVNNTATLIIEPAGVFTNASGTFDNGGSFNNQGLFTNGSTFLNKGNAENAAQFNNNNLLSNLGAFTNRTTGTLEQSFGSQLINEDAFVNEGAINSFGLLQNDKDFFNEGNISMQSGSSFRNNDSFTNNGELAGSDGLRNDADFFNNGLLEVNSGGVFSNFGNFENNPSGEVINRQEILNKPGATFLNNGMLKNLVRFFIEGNLENQVFIENQGDIFILPGGRLENKAMLLQAAGNIRNQGELRNSDHFVSDNCSSINNQGTLDNNGLFELFGILFQNGTLSGNPLTLNGGYIHAAEGPEAPSICRDGEFGTTIAGEIKVYASELIAFANFDSCNNMVYRANGLDRPVFTCQDVGTVQNVRVVLTTRLADSLTCTAHVTPVDNLAPVFDACPENQVIMTMDDGETATWTAPVATDNCTSLSLSTTHEPGSFFPVGLTFVTYTAEDENGNVNQCQFRIDVRKLPPVDECEGDTEAPVFTLCPEDIQTTTETDFAIVVWEEPMATDECLPLNICGDHESGEAFPVGTTQVSYSAIDGAGNKRFCQFNVTVVFVDPCANDEQNPSIANCPANISITVNPLLNGAVAGWIPPTASDNCGIFSFGADYLPNTIFLVGSTKVTYTATDLSGNVATCSFFVNVGGDPCPGDVTGPSLFNCPGNITLVTDGNNAIADWTAPTAIDPCEVVSFVSNYSPGTLFPLGTRQVIYQASDGKGNVSQCVFSVTVQNVCQIDITPPVISGCPSDIKIKASAGGTATATWTPPTATDNCTLVSFSASYYPGASFPVGVTTVVYRAMDLRGNSSACFFNVTVEKKDPPVVVCKNLKIELNEQGEAFIMPQSIYQGCLQNCESATPVSVTPSAFDCGRLGENEAILEVEDRDGNIGRCSSIVTVELGTSRLISYTILAQEEIHLHKNTVNGNIGIWQDGKEAKIHEATTVSGFVRAPKIDLDGSSSIANSRTLAQAPSPPGNTFRYNNQPEPKNDTKVPDNFAGSYKLNGTNFKKIEIGKNSRALFTATGDIFVNELILKDADNGKVTSLLFSGNTTLIVKKKVEIGKRSEFNWTGNGKVRIYATEDDVVVKEQSKVNASIDVRFKDLKVEDASSSNPTVMIGQFIAKKVDSKKYVEWHWAPFGCEFSAPPVAPVLKVEQFNFSASLEHEQVRLNWVTNTDFKNETFEVERSQNGTDFEPIFEVLPKGNDDHARLYQDHDDSPNHGVNFYRIKVTFKDGTVGFSEVRRVNMPIDRKVLTLYPNPVNQTFSLYREDFCGRQAIVRILDSRGTLMSELTFEALPHEPLSIDATGLKDGLYLLHIKVDGFQGTSKRFMVAKID
jgi:hypothetical protein